MDEAEVRRIFYVAPTRARDHIILTSAAGQTTALCGLTLLRPGLELAGTGLSPVPFNPEDARPPELATPVPPAPPGLLLEPVV
jgi:hypothetical protein